MTDEKIQKPIYVFGRIEKYNSENQALILYSITDYRSGVPHFYKDTGIKIQEIPSDVDKKSVCLVGETEIGEWRSLNESPHLRISQEFKPKRVVIEKSLEETCQDQALELERIRKENLDRYLHAATNNQNCYVFEEPLKT